MCGSREKEEALYERKSEKNHKTEKIWTETLDYSTIRRKKGVICMIEFLGIGAAFTGVDLCLKNQIESQKEENFPMDLPGTNGKIRLYRNHNSGFSFGVLEENQQIVEKLPLCVASFLAGAWVWAMGKKGFFLEKLALTLTLAGGASNLYDRMTRGYVVDYFSVQLGWLKKVVLNLGDLMIFLGSALMIVSELIETFRRR